MRKFHIFVALTVFLLGLGFLSAVGVGASREKPDEQLPDSVGQVADDAAVAQGALSEPVVGQGQVSGQINGVSFKGAPLMARMDPKTRRVTIELSAIPAEIGSSMRSLPSLIPPVCWTALPQDQPPEALWPCQGLEEESVLEYATGEVLRMKVKLFSYQDGPFNVIATLNGTLPEIPLAAKVTLDEQRLVPRREGSGPRQDKHAQPQRGTYRVDGEPFSYSWRRMAREQKEARVATEEPPSWQIRTPVVTYEPNSERIRWEMTALVGEVSSRPASRALGSGLASVSVGASREKPDEQLPDSVGQAANDAAVALGALSEPVVGQGQVSGQINGVSFKGAPLMARMDPKTRRVTIELSAIPAEIGSSMRSLPSLIPPVCWTALPQDQPPDALSPCQGLEEESVLEYATGEVLRMKVKLFSYKDGSLNVIATLNGTLPEIPLAAKVALDEQRLVPRREGSGSRQDNHAEPQRGSYRVNGKPFSYSWRRMAREQKEARVATEEPPSWQIRTPVVTYEPNSERIRWEMTTLVGEVSSRPANRAFGSRSGGISGSVTAADGTSLSDIEVTAYREQPWGWDYVQSTSTDASGSYQLLNLGSAIYRLRFRDNSGAYAFEYYNDALTLDEADDIAVTGEIVPNMNAELSLAGHIAGTAMMFDGQVPGYGGVDLYHSNGSNWERVGNTYFDWETGEYDFGGLPGGVYRLHAHADYQGAYFQEYYENASDIEHATDITVTTGSSTGNIDIVFDEYGGRIAGTVTSESGTALPNIAVTAYISNGWSWSSYRSTATDVSGNYQLLALDPALYKIRFRDNDGSYAFEYYSNTTSLDSAIQISVTEGVTTTNINAELSLAGHIAGTGIMFDGQVPGYGGVDLYHFDGSHWERVGSTYFEWETGEYDLGGLRSGVYRLRAHADYQGAYFEQYYENASEIENATDITVTMGTTTGNIDIVFGEDGGRIAGAVTSESGTALPNIAVTAYISNGGSWSSYRSTATDMSGNYQFLALDPALYKIRFRDYDGTYAFEYYSKTLSLDSATQISVTEGLTVTNINAELSLAGRIAGTGTMFDGQVPGYGGVDLYHSNGSQWERVGGTSFEWETGEYDLGGLPSGVYRLHAHADYQGAYFEQYYENASEIEHATDITVTMGSTTGNIDIVFGERGGRIAGTVRSESGTPLPNIAVTAYISDGGSWSSYRSTATDLSGNYQLLALDPALYKIRFRDYNGSYALEYYSNTLSLDSAIQISVTEGLTVTNINAELSLVGHIAGTVTMFDGQVPGYGGLDLYHSNGSNWERVGNTYFDSQTGEYYFSGLRSGIYRLRAHAEYQGAYFEQYYENASDIEHATDITVTMGSTTGNIDVVFGERGGRIAGAVTSESGTPLPNIRVTAYIGDGGNWWSYRSTATDLSGNYQFFALDPALYKIGFRDDDGSYAFEYYSNTLSLDSATQISVTEGVTTTNINAELSLAGRIAGTAMMFDGQAPGYGRVDLYRSNGQGFQWVGDTSFEWETGEYDFDGLQSGIYRLHAHADYQGAYFQQYYENASDIENATDITVTMGTTTGNIDIVFGEHGGRIAGAVTSESGTPLPNIAVTAYISDGWSWSSYRSTATDMSGNYQLFALDPALYKIGFRDYDGSY
ncbi:MAG: carboxypeptidase regulatory-like domain-containing protein, partial [Ardenticatenaceae bacterium]